MKGRRLVKRVQIVMGCLWMGWMRGVWRSRWSGGREVERMINVW